MGREGVNNAIFGRTSFTDAPISIKRMNEYGKKNCESLLSGILDRWMQISATSSSYRRPPFLRRRDCENWELVYISDCRSSGSLLSLFNRKSPGLSAGRINIMGIEIEQSIVAWSFQEGENKTSYIHQPALLLFFALPSMALSSTNSNLGPQEINVTWRPCTT